MFAEAMRSHGVEHDIWLLPEADRPPADPLGYDAVLVFGGAMHVDHEDRHPWLGGEKALLRELIQQRVPLLGVCLGAQLVAQATGAVAQRASEPEIGWHDVEVTPEGATDPVLAPLAPRFTAFQWHSYEFTLPSGATPLARSDVCLQAFRLRDHVWGIQFHAEVSEQDAQAWIDDYRSDEDAVRIGLDPEALRARTRRSIKAWNDAGRALCKRFLATRA